MVGTLLESSYFVSPTPSPDRRFLAKLRDHPRRVSASKMVSTPRVPMMSETTVVDARLDKLEQDNRRLKLTVGALLLALAAVPLIGAVMPQQIPDVIQAQQFEVIYRAGTRRVMINGKGFILMDQNDTTVAAIAASGIAQYDGNGNRRNVMADDVIWRTPER